MMMVMNVYNHAPAQLQHGYTTDMGALTGHPSM